MWNLLRIFWHEFTCPAARHGAAVVVVSPAGRVYDCGCGFGISEAVYVETEA